MLIDFGAASLYFCRLATPSEAARRKGEEANEEEGDCHRLERCLHSLILSFLRRRETSAPQISDRPMILPNRYDERQDSAGNQRQPQVVRRLRKIGRLAPGRSDRRSKNWTIVKPKPISETAVRIHDIKVRSTLNRVRSQPKWVSAVTLTSNRSVTGPILKMPSRWSSPPAQARTFREVAPRTCPS